MEGEPNRPKTPPHHPTTRTTGATAAPASCEISCATSAVRFMGETNCQMQRQIHRSPKSKVRGQIFDPWLDSTRNTSNRLPMLPHILTGIEVAGTAQLMRWLARYDPHFQAGSKNKPVVRKKLKALRDEFDEDEEDAGG